MSVNTGDSPIRRAAGMIAFLWGRRKRHSAEVYSLQEAVARAAEHEPQLTDEQLRYAAGWAMAAHGFRELANTKGNALTLGELRDKSGLTYYADRGNFPGD